tara:strand:+ start:87 stop:3518 length:3432 start_codon:yes stop_codon:yes gene_type:complete
VGDGRLCISDDRGPIPHNKVVNFLRAARKDTLVDVWYKERPGRIACNALARLVRQGDGFGLHFTSRRCRRCDQWHDNEFDEDIHGVPDKAIDYIRLTLLTDDSLHKAIPQCHDDDCGSDDGSDENPEWWHLIQDPPSVADDDRQYTSLEGQVNLNDLQRECLDSFPTSSKSVFTPRNVANWFTLAAPGHRPSGVHRIVWERYTSKTRANHVKWLNAIRNAPPDLRDVSLPKAVVELVLKTARVRAWAWSTISSALSTAASAFRDAHLYTNYNESVDIRSDPYFRQAQETAQRNAKTGAIKPLDAGVMTYEHYRAALRTLEGDRPAWLLLVVSWHFAARVGDARRILPCKLDINFADQRTTPGSSEPDVACFALFTEGKGASFWGPYTIHARIPLSFAKVLSEYIANKTNPSAPTAASDRRSLENQHLFTTADQARLSTVVNAIPGLDLRAVRKGALTFFADAGVSDFMLQQLSGHKRRDTLLRYLGWGRRSSEASSAANVRADLGNRHIHGTAGSNVAPSGGEPVLFDNVNPRHRHPTWMGPSSGYHGREGKRVKHAPSMFTMQPPSTEDLGVHLIENVDTSTWPLHATPTGEVDWAKLKKLVSDPQLLEALEIAHRWTQFPEWYGVDWPEMTASQIPYSDFGPEDIQTMYKVGKLTTLGNRPIRAAAKGFPVAQFNKLRRRPVFETLYNPVAWKSRRPPLSYPHRLPRRAKMVGKKYFFQFDFHAWFDQLRLSEAVLPYHVIRVKQPVWIDGGWHTEFCLLKDAMGSCHSAHTANTVTWAILEPILKMKGVEVSTMIDNVAIASDDRDSFITAFQTFVDRCKQVGAKLNDEETFPKHPENIARLGLDQARGPTVFLGEEYTAGRVGNSPRNLEKLRLAYERLQEASSDPNIVSTRRHVQSIISLAIWMGNTIEIPLCKHFDMMRLYSDLARQGDWDRPLTITAHILNTLGPIVGPIGDNVAVQPHVPRPPGNHHSDYDATIIMDAYVNGFGGYVRFHDTGRVVEFRQGFRNPIKHSAWSEPIGAAEIVEWVRKELPPDRQRLAVVTDHIAMVTAQRRPGSGHGGFSMSYHLNRFFNVLYTGFSDRADVFHVEGTKNITDLTSRSVRLNDPRRIIDRSDVTFPPLSDFAHPYRTQEPAKWWNV